MFGVYILEYQVIHAWSLKSKEMSKVDLEDAYNKENVQIHSKALVKRHGQE